LLLTNSRPLRQQEKLYQALQPRYALASQMLHNSLKDLTCHTLLYPWNDPVDIDTFREPSFFFLFLVVTKTTPFDALFPNKAVELSSFSIEILSISEYWLNLNLRLSEYRLLRKGHHLSSKTSKSSYTYSLTRSRLSRQSSHQNSWPSTFNRTG
jgi:hypothetical protein